MVSMPAECHWERFKSGMQQDMALSGIGSDLLGELWGYALRRFFHANSEAEIIGLVNHGVGEYLAVVSRRKSIRVAGCG